MSRRLHSPELAAIEVAGMTRSAFILRGALATGALYGAGAVTPFVSGALAQTSEADLAVLNFAYGLEQLEAAFYEAALKNANLPADLKKLATEFGEHETQHVDVLKQTIEQLGGKAGEVPKATFGVTDRESFLRTAVQLEDLGVGAYNGAGPELTSADLIDAAGAIVQVEARHAAALRFRAGEDPAPAPFDAPIPAQQVAAAAQKFLGG
jgi:rubrerythrin